MMMMMVRKTAACLSIVSLGRGVGTCGQELILRRESQAVQHCT
jgi:hypothetical protein